MATSAPSARSGPRLVIRRPRDVVDAINSGRVSGGHQTAIVIIALGGIFIDAYDFTALAFGLPDIAKAFGLGALMEGVVAASIMVGALLGALVGGYLVDRIGRYKMFMADMLFFVVAAFGCALSTDVWMLLAFRFLLGLGIGLDFPVALAFLAEYSATRGKAGRVSLWQPMWYIATGSSFLVLLPLYFLIPEADHGQLWRWAVGFGAVPALVVLLVRHKYMEESASWAARQGDLEGAVRVLRNSYGANAVLAEDAERQPKVERRRISLSDMAFLFSPRYRRRTILAGVVSACQSMQYYAVGFFLPYIVGEFFAGGQLTKITVPLIFNFAFGVAGGFAGVALARRLGSWWLAFSGFAICLVCLILLGLLGKPGSDAGLLIAGVALSVFVFFHAYGPGAQGMTMATLSYPTSLRGTGTGFGQATLRVGSMISLLLFPVLSHALGAHVFWVVAIAPILGLITLVCVRWDPSRHEVDDEDFETETHGASI